MKSALVLGGTRFFGKRLVHKLLENGWQVTVATRGQTPDPFGEQVDRLTVDRHNLASLERAVEGRTWDAVFDQLCFAPSDAADACKVFGGRIRRYILTSTGAVYEGDERPYKEEGFDPYTYPIKLGRRDEYSYGEGKKLAEAVLFQQSEFEVAAARFPVVMGPDDYTKRLLWHVGMVKQGAIIGTPDKDKGMAFISSQMAADFLFWLADAEITGPYNASSTGSTSLARMTALIGEIVGKKPILSDNKETNPSPLNGSSWLSPAKAQAAGFPCPDLMKWLPDLIKHLSQQ